METLHIQLTNQKAIGLLHEMEELKLIKVLKDDKKGKKKLSDKYAGKLPAAFADKLQNYVTKSRKEWNNKSI